MLLIIESATGRCPVAMLRCNHRDASDRTLGPWESKALILCWVCGFLNYCYSKSFDLGEKSSLRWDWRGDGPQTLLVVSHRVDLWDAMWNSSESSTAAPIAQSIPKQELDVSREAMAHWCCCGSPHSSPEWELSGCPSFRKRKCSILSIPPWTIAECDNTCNHLSLN